MKVTIVSKFFDFGGAAIAAKRLFTLFRKYQPNIDAYFFVQQDLLNKKDLDRQVISTINGKISRWTAFFYFVWERIIFLRYEKSKELRFIFSLANSGENIAKRSLIKTSDIIHLHWINQGFLSLHGFKQLTKLNKPIVWTLHDMWVFTGGCHYNGNCANYMNGCGSCPVIKKQGEDDISKRLFTKKQELFSKANLTILTCSKWLQRQAKSSPILNNVNVLHIPNSIDTNVYKTGQKNDCRKKLNLPQNKFLILLLAANILDKRKGFDLFRAATKKLNIELKELAANTEIIIIGKNGEEAAKVLSLPTHKMGLISDEQKIVQVYQSADVFVLPTLQDNLPNTVMEALSCGLPCVSYNVGGLPEMIDHKQNGYLAESGDVSSLAEGIKWIYMHPDKITLSNNARQKVLSTFSEEVVTRQHYELYSKLLNKHK